LLRIDNHEQLIPDII